MKASEYVDIGKYLHDSRESLRIPIEQAAQALHIRAKYLRALESGKLDELPGKAYIRGYIRNYVEYLQLDVAEVLGAYEALLGHKGHDFFVPEPTLKQNMPSKRTMKAAAIGMVVVYGFWYFAIHDRTAITQDTAEMPQEFTQMLDKTSRAAMDKAWEACVEDGDIGCFIARHQQTVIPSTNVMKYYEPNFAKTSPQKP